MGKKMFLLLFGFLFLLVSAYASNQVEDIAYIRYFSGAEFVFDSGFNVKIKSSGFWFFKNYFLELKKNEKIYLKEILNLKDSSSVFSKIYIAEDRPYLVLKNAANQGILFVYKNYSLNFSDEVGRLKYVFLKDSDGYKIKFNYKTKNILGNTAVGVFGQSELIYNLNSNGKGWFFLFLVSYYPKYDRDIRSTFVGYYDFNKNIFFVSEVSLFDFEFLKKYPQFITKNHEYYVSKRKDYEIKFLRLEEKLKNYNDLLALKELYAPQKIITNSMVGNLTSLLFAYVPPKNLTCAKCHVVSLKELIEKKQSTDYLRFLEKAVNYTIEPLGNGRYVISYKKNSDDDFPVVAFKDLDETNFKNKSFKIGDEIFRIFEAKPTVNFKKRNIDVPDDVLLFVGGYYAKRYSKTGTKDVFVIKDIFYANFVIPKEKVRVNGDLLFYNNCEVSLEKYDFPFIVNNKEKHYLILGPGKSYFDSLAMIPFENYCKGEKLVVNSCPEEFNFVGYYKYNDCKTKNFGYCVEKEKSKYILKKTKYGGGKYFEKDYQKSEYVLKETYPGYKNAYLYNYSDINPPKKNYFNRLIVLDNNGYVLCVPKKNQKGVTIYKKEGNEEYYFVLNKFNVNNFEEYLVKIIFNTLKED